MKYPIEQFLYLPKGDHRLARIRVDELTAVTIELNIQDLISKRKNPYIKMETPAIKNYEALIVARAIWNPDLGVLIEGRNFCGESMIRGKIIAPRFFICPSTLNDEFMRTARFESSDPCMGEFVDPSQSIFHKEKPLVPEVLFSAKLPQPGAGCRVAGQDRGARRDGTH